jgi:hypothetical protein
VRTETRACESARVLGEANELASPHFLRVAIVDDGVVRFEATMMEVLVPIDPRILVMGKLWSSIVRKYEERKL